VVSTLYDAQYEGKKISMKQRITALDVAHELAGTKVRCWKIEKTTDMPASTVTALYSAEVPGGIVRREGSAQWGEFKSQPLDVVTGFEAKKERRSYFTPHTRTDPSTPAPATSLPSGLKITVAVCAAASVASGFPSFTLQNRTVLS